MKYVVKLYLNHFMAKLSNFIVEKAEKIDSNQLDTFLREGHLTVCHARCIIVGCAGAEKTTLLKRLQGMSYRDVREKLKQNLWMFTLTVLKCWKRKTQFKVKFILPKRPL